MTTSRRRPRRADADDAADRRRRGAGAERLPLPVLGLAPSPSPSSPSRSSACSGALPWSTAVEILTDARCARRCGCRSSARCGRPGCRCCSACRWRGCWPGSSFPGRGIVRALCTLSMVLPPVVGGVALFFALGRRGLVGQYLDRWFGIHAPVHDRRRRHRPDVRGDAVPRAHRRGRAAPARPPLRRRRPHARARRAGTRSGG